jgi:hypothetical protein
LSEELLPPKSYSAYELAALRLPGKPTTAKGWYQLVEREKWLEVKATGSGRGRKDGLRREFIPPDDIRQLIKAVGQSGYSPRVPVDHVVSEKSPIYTNGDTKKIRHYVNVRGSAGPGYSVEDETVIEVSVDTQLLRERFGTNFANIQIVGVRGDSMEPTLSHGDQVAVDTSCDRFIDDAIYAIQQNGDLRFKRIRLHLDGSIEVISDNERFQNINRPEIYKPEQLSGVHIIGRVIPLKFGLFKV